MFIVAVSFVLGFGLLSLGGLSDIIRSLTNQEGPRHPDELGRVGNKVIKQTEFDNMKNYYKWLYTLNTGTRNVPSKVDEQIGQQAWSYLVSEKALEDVYKKIGDVLLFDEVVEILKMAPPREAMSDSTLYTDGKFDPQKYQRVLYTQQFIQQHFPAYQDYVRNKRLESDLQGAFRVPLAQANDEQTRDWTRFNVTFLAIEPNTFVKTPDDKEIWAYYNAHRSEFAIPERRTMRYALLPVTVTKEDSDVAKSQIDETYASLKTPDDFQYASDRQDESVGVWVKTDSLDSLVKVVVKDLPVGSHSTSFLTNAGWQIVQLDDQSGDSIRVRYATVPIELTSSTISDLHDKIDNLTQRGKTEDLDSVAKDLGVEVREAPMLEKGKPYEFDAELNGTVEAFARHAKVGDVSDPMRNSRDEIYIFKLTGIKRGIASVMDSFEIRNKVSSKIVADQARPLMEARAQEALSKIRAGKTLEEIAQGDSLVRLQTRQQTTVAGFNYLGPEFSGTLFALQPQQVSGLVKTDRGDYVIRCDSRELLTQGGNPETYAQGKQNAALTRLRESLLQQPKIVDYRNALNF
jgi:peptidyl-prolyl cis-trans isomerase D